MAARLVLIRPKFRQVASQPKPLNIRFTMQGWRSDFSVFRKKPAKSPDGDLNPRSNKPIIMLRRDGGQIFRCSEKNPPNRAVARFKSLNIRFTLQGWRSILSADKNPPNRAVARFKSLNIRFTLQGWRSSVKRAGLRTLCLSGCASSKAFAGGKNLPA